MVLFRVLRALGKLDKRVDRPGMRDHFFSLAKKQLGRIDNAGS